MTRVHSHPSSHAKLTAPAASLQTARLGKSSCVALCLNSTKLCGKPNCLSAIEAILFAYTPCCSESARELTSLIRASERAERIALPLEEVGWWERAESRRRASIREAVHSMATGQGEEERDR